MKERYIAALLVLAMFMVVGISYAQTNTGYTCYSVSVNSATVPVAVLPLNPPAKPSGWTITERAQTGGSTSAANVLAFPYVGTTVPTGVPSACASPSATLTNTGCIEITPTRALSDAVGCDAPSCVGPIGQAWAAVLETGSTAVDVDSCLR